MQWPLNMDWDHLDEDHRSSEEADFIHNNPAPGRPALKTRWLDKAYLRMGWWPHVRPVLLHPGIPTPTSLRPPFPEIGTQRRLYPERCQRRQGPLVFPKDHLIDTKSRLLMRLEDNQVVETRPIDQESWVFTDADCNCGLG
jgi:hypothetical protein